MKRWLASCALSAVLFVPSVIAAAAPPSRPSAQRVAARFDEPEEAARWYWLKRSPDGISPLPVEKYFEALEKMQSMPQYSTALRARLSSRAQLARSGAKPAAALGAWSWLGPGNIGGRTRALVIHPTTPTTMYAGGVAGGVWKTTNGGSSWAPLDDFLPNLAVTTLAMDPANPNVLYAGTGEISAGDGVRGGGILKSADAGATWTRIAATATPDFYYVNKILVSASSGRVYAATWSGILRSADGGATWTKVYPSALPSGVTDLAMRTDQSTDVLFAADGNQVQATIYRNTDAAGSGTWSPVYTEALQGNTSLAIAPSNQNVIYALSASIEAGDYNGGLLAVFRSTDGGTSWTTQVRNTSPTKLNTLLLTNPITATLMACGYPGPDQFVNQGWYDNVIAVDPVDPNRVWAGGIDLFRSDDGGANWGIAAYWWMIPDPHYAHGDYHTIVFHPQYNGTSNQTMYVGNDGGLFRTDGTRSSTSTDICGNAPGSVVWTSLNNNYGVTQFYHGLPYPNGTTYFGGAQDNGTNRGSDAAGPNAWARLIGGDGGFVAIDPGNTNVIYGEYPNLSLQKSTDGGTTFASATSGITEPSSQFGFITPFVMDPSNSQGLWIGGRMPWRTTNGGTSWTQAGTAFTTLNYPTTAIAVAPTDGNYVLFGRSSGIVSRTTTGLTNTSTTVWSQVLPTPVQAYNSWLTFDPANKNVAYATYSSFGVPHVWKSTNAGATWTSIDGAGSTGIPDIPVHCIVVDPGNTSRLYVGTDLGVFVSTDGGANWSIENTGFANVVTEALAMNATSLFAFTHGRGAYRVALTSSTAPVDFTISASPASLDVTAGGGASSQITTAVSGGFSSGISLSASGLPAGATASFSPATISSPGSGTSTMSISTSSSTLADTYDVTVTGSGGGKSHAATIFLAVWSGFALSASPTSLSVTAGGGASSQITTAVSGGFSSGISLSASGLPAGATASFSPATISSPGSGTSTMSISTSSSTPAGTYTVTVTGSGGGKSHAATISLAVTGGSPDFALSASPASLQVTAGGGASSQITTAVSGGFSSGISLSASGLPAGATASFSPATISSPGSGTSTMSISTSSSTLADTYDVTVTGSGGGKSHAATIFLAVWSGFALSASPTSLSVTAGGGASSQITTAVSGGFSSGISLSASGLPAGATASFSPATISSPGSGTSTMSISTSSSTLADTYDVTVTGSGGGKSHAATIFLAVRVSSVGPSSCVEDAATMCLTGGRYQIRSHWKNQYAGGAVSTLSKAKLTDVTGAFWIANSSTYEYLIRFNTATDNGRVWITIPTFTDVEFWIDVTDTRTGQSNEYHSPAGNRTLLYDTNTFVYP
jgi:uncharacterized membrane protein